MHPIDQIVGQNLREARIKADVSQEKLGDIVGVSFQQIQKYESGKNRISASKLVDIANALGIELEELFLGVAEQLPRDNVKTLKQARREHAICDHYAQMPKDMQDAVAGLVKAIIINLGRTFKEGVK